MITESTLREIINVSELSTYTAVYNGIAKVPNPDKPEEIAAAIRSLLDDPERRAAMGERGYGALQTRFNWQTEEKKLLALYEELLSLKGE